MQKVNGNSKIELSLRSVILTAHLNAASYIEFSDSNMITKDRSSKDVSINAVRQDLDLIFLAIFSGVLSFPINSMEFDLYEDGAYAVIEIVGIFKDIEILIDIGGDINLRAAKQLIELKLDGDMQMVSENRNFTIKIKIPSNLERSKIYLQISAMPLQDSVKDQLSHILKSKKIDYVSEVMDASWVFTDDEQFALNISNGISHIFLITKDGGRKNNWPSSIRELSKSRIAMEEESYLNSVLQGRS